MIDEVFLKKLGFVDFIPLRKELRDSQKRLTKVVILADCMLTIQVILQNGSWQTEKLLYNGDKSLLQKFIPNGMSLNEIIDLFFPVLKNNDDRILRDPSRL